MNTTDTPKVSTFAGKLAAESYAFTLEHAMGRIADLERERNALKRMVELLKKQLTGKLEEVVKNHKSNV